MHLHDCVNVFLYCFFFFVELYHKEHVDTYITFCTDTIKCQGDPPSPIIYCFCFL